MRSVVDRLIPVLAAMLIRTIRVTMRVRYVYPESVRQLLERKSQFVLTFWHGQLLMMVYARYAKPIMMMSSRHRDGELIVRTMRWFGAVAARGSRTRGGIPALRTMIRAARDGFTLAITPDGPRGPRHIASMGVVQIAQATALPVVPVALVVERKTVLRSWDEFEIPHLFTRGVFAYGEPISVRRELTSDEAENVRVQIENALNDLVAGVEGDFATAWERGQR